MTNAQKYTKLAEDEITQFKTAQADARTRHEKSILDGEVEERYFENVFYADEAAAHLMLAKVYAQLASVPEQIIIGDPTFEEAAQKPEQPTADPLEDLKKFVSGVPGIITLIQTTARPRG